MSKIYKNASRKETRKDASRRQCSYCVSRIICRYSVVSNAMIRKEKVSINLGFPFEMLECGHSLRATKAGSDFTYQWLACLLSSCHQDTFLKLYLKELSVVDTILVVELRPRPLLEI